MSNEYLQQLEATLKQVISPSTEGIKAASERLQNDFYNRSESVAALIQLLQTHPDVQIRQLAGVEARKLVPKFWKDEIISREQQSQIKESLNSSTFAEQNALVRHTSARVLSTIASIDLSAGHGTMIFPWLKQKTESSDPADRETAVFIFYSLLESEVEILLEHPSDLLNIYAKTMGTSESLQTRVYSLMGMPKIAEYIYGYEDPDTTRKTPDKVKAVELFRSLIPSMVEVLKDIIKENDEKSAGQAFGVFNEILFCDNSLLSKHLVDLVDFMGRQIALQRGLSDDFRIPAFQFLITAVRYRKSKIQSSKLAPGLVNICLQVASEPIEDDDDEDDEDEENEEDTPQKLALRLIDYLSASLPPSHVIEPLLVGLQQASQSADPNHRRAGLAALAQAVEGSPDYVSGELGQVFPVVVRGLQDTDRSVSISALEALAVLASELQDDIGAEHEVLLPLVFAVMDGATSLRIAKAACGTLDAILATIDASIIAEKYLNDLVPKLLTMLEHTANYGLKELLVNAIGSAAFSASKSFDPFFEPTIHSFEKFLGVLADTDSATDDEIKLAGATLDALASIAGAVGRERFSPYVQVLMQSAFQALKAPKSRLRENTFSFIGIVARLYGEEFSPFVDAVVEEIYHTLNQNEFTGLNDDDDDENEVIGMDDDENLEDKIGINSALAIEKEVAIDTMTDIICGVKGNFASHLEKATKELIEMTDHFYDGIRKSALRALWSAYITFFAASGDTEWTPGYPSTKRLNPTVEGLGKLVRETSLRILGDEDERSVVTTFFELYSDALLKTGPAILGSENELNEVCGQILLVLDNSHPCQVDDEQEDQDEEDNEGYEAGEENAEYDDLVIYYAFELISRLASSMGPQFAPIFAPFYEKFVSYSRSSNKSDRVTSIGALSELISSLKQLCTPYTSDFLQLLLKALGDKVQDVRSNAAYGVGLLGYYSEDPSIEGHVITIIQKIQRMLRKAEKKRNLLASTGGDGEEDNQARSMANACGCVARLATRYPNVVPIPETVTGLLELLPLTEGYEEYYPIWQFFAKLLQENNQAALSQREKIVEVFRDMFVIEKKIQDKNERVPTDYDGPFPGNSKEQAIEFLRLLETNQPGLVSSFPELGAVMH